MGSRRYRLAALLAPLAFLLAAAFVLTASARDESQLKVGKNLDVSRAQYSQNEVRVTEDPRNPNVLLAASNSHGEDTMRVYGSVNAGSTWTSTAVPPRETTPPADRCIADPSVAIDREGRQFFLYLRAEPCREEISGMYLARRAGPSGRWTVPAGPLLPPLSSGSFDDNPWLAADVSSTSPFHDRLYIAWVRFAEQGEIGVLLTHSDDHGATWTAPVTVNDQTNGSDGYPSIAIDRQGVVLVGWQDFTGRLIKVDRSVDGGETFGVDAAIPVRMADSQRCPNGIPIPAQASRCVRSDPTVLATSDGAFVTYSDLARNGSTDLFGASLDNALKLRDGFPRRIGPGETHPADQFWPTSAVDEVTGKIWLCFYDTAGRARTAARFSCLAGDGRTWTKPVRVASVDSSEAGSRADEIQFGDYEGLVVHGGIAHPMWTDSRDLRRFREEIYTSTVTLQPSRTLASGELRTPKAAGPIGLVAFHADPGGDDELYVASADGGDPRRLTSGLEQIALATWAPDGKRLAFRARPFGVADIFTIDADGSHLRRLTRGEGEHFDLSWSPDGKHLAYTCCAEGRAGVYVMNSNGSGRRLLAPNSGQPAWSPDGKKIAYISFRDGNAEIYSMNANGTARTRLTVNGSEDVDPAWSPDSKWLAFDSKRTGKSQVFTMSADGRRQRRLVSDNWTDQQPIWSPDGRRIVFTSYRNRDPLLRGIGNAEIIVASRGGKVANLTRSPAWEGDPAWSPDGKWLAFATRTDFSARGGFRVGALEANGTGRRLLPAVPSGPGATANSCCPAWQPNR